jgi:hypothetical protein
MSPGTDVVEVEDVAVWFGGEFGGGGARDGGAECGVAATEVPVFVGVVVDCWFLSNGC